MKDSAWLLDKLRNPASLEAADQAELREIIAEFPYFSLPYLLLARQMHQHKHPAYEQLLPVISLRAQDRKKLFRLVHEWDGIKQSTPLPEADPKPEETTSESKSSIEEETPTEQKSEITETVSKADEAIDDPEEAGPQLEEPVEEEAKPATRFSIDASGIEKDGTEEHQEREELQEIPFGKARGLEQEQESEQEQEEEQEASYQVEDVEPEELASNENQVQAPVVEEQPLVEENIEDKQEAKAEEAIVSESSMDNFFSWLDRFDHLKAAEQQAEFAADSPVEVAEENEEEASAVAANERHETAPIADQLNIIDQFIEKQPSVSRIQGEFYDPAVKAKASEQLEEDMVTETLAKIFLQQEKYGKAREAYEKLQLKYPEKKAYFAALISEINEKST